MPVRQEYGFKTTLAASYEEAVERVTAALKARGFGILTRIDAQATLKEKLGRDTRRYMILGACNPPLAHRAMETEPGIGLLLPCNVIVYEEEGTEGTVVSFADPRAMLQVSGNAGLAPIAEEARERLQEVLAALD
jgi:uncharacterized protein (DUF302 family)